MDVHCLIAGDSDTLAGSYLYDKRIMQGLAEHGWQAVLHALGAGFPTPDEAELDQARAILGGLADHSLVVIDGAALGGMPGLVSAERTRLRLLALIHHPLAAETDLTPNLQVRLYQTEREALACVARVIVTGPRTAQTLMDNYAVDPARIGVVIPGTDPAPLSKGSGQAELELLCVASLTPRKGHAILLAALADLKDRPWRLTCAGSLTRDPRCAKAILDQIAALALTDRVTLAGELAGDPLAALYARADVFVLASHLEGYGMALAEALACGLPIISTRAGAIPDTVPVHAGMLVPPGDIAALTQALGRIIDEPELRQRLRAGAAQVRPTLPTWEQACARFAAELGRH